MIKVILGEDHHLVREAVRALLEKADDIEVIAEASDGQEALNLVTRYEPDVLVIDVSMPKMTGILVTEALKRQKSRTQVVILSVHSKKTIIQQALKSGALGYVVKQTVSQELLEAIRAASQGERYLNEIVQTVMSTEEQIPQQLSVLTLREQQVLKLIAEGNTNKEIADLLSLHIKTIEKHRASLINKLKINDVPSLVRVALKFGLISLEDS